MINFALQRTTATIRCVRTSTTRNGTTSTRRARQSRCSMECDWQVAISAVREPSRRWRHLPARFNRRRQPQQRRHLPGVDEAAVHFCPAQRQRRVPHRFLGAPQPLHPPLYPRVRRPLRIFKPPLSSTEPDNSGSIEHSNNTNRKQ